MKQRTRTIGEYRLMEVSTKWAVRIRDAVWYVIEEQVPGGYQVLLVGIDWTLRDFRTVAAALAYAEDNTA